MGSAPIISVVGLMVASTLAESEQEPTIVREDDTVRIDDTANLEVFPVQCSEACPLLFKPICGGILGGSQETFVNECQLKHRNCLNHTNWVVLHPGKCTYTTHTKY